MSEFAEYYAEKLYPLQNGVLRTLEGIHSPFYLTGGTALGREYTRHRYSDDLDFFLNDDPKYEQYVQKAYFALRDAGAGSGFEVVEGDSLFEEKYSRFFLAGKDARLKLDFVNDISFRLGPIRKGKIFSLMDSAENILSNKITALYRFEPKDISDIWAIAKSVDFEWSIILDAAKKKEAGVDAKNAAEIVRGFPERLFGDIKWIERPNQKKFFADLEKIAFDILSVGRNSLFS